MTAEPKQETRPAIGTKIAALKCLLAEVAGGLDAGERLIAVSWGRRGGKILRALRWPGLAVSLAAFLLYESHLIQEGLILGIMLAAILAAAVAQWAGVSRIARYGVLLTDRRLIVVPTTDLRVPRVRGAPTFVSRGDVSATFGHGYFGTTVVLTLTTPVSATPLRLSFDGPYVPPATAIYGSLASPGTAASLSLPPPGPALSDSRTRAVLRRYRYGAWLTVLIGVALFALLVLFGSRPEGTVPDGLIFTTFIGAPVLICGGLWYRFRAARWHRILSRYPWREVSYRYSEQEVTTSGPWGVPFSVPRLVTQPLAEPRQIMALNLPPVPRWVWWLLRGWRQVPTGAAWLAGDPSHLMIVTRPGPDRLFSARHRAAR